MSKRHDHDMSGRVGKGVKNDEAAFAAIYDVRLGIVAKLRQIAENAAGGLGACDKGVSPWGPEIIHRKAE